MIKRASSPYLPGRPKGYWYKWKRDPYLVDAVMMYGQRGHGKRSSFYSDYTFGVWRDGPDGEELVPVGKAYHGFTDEELVKLDRYVRNHTVNRFGPVREVEYGKDRGLVLEVAFEGLQRSTRHKSGVAMRFPRISRIRWDKPAAEADRIETLEKILERGEKEIHPLKEQQTKGGMTMLQCGNPFRGKRDAAGERPARGRNRRPRLHRDHRGRCRAGCSAPASCNGLLTVFCRHTSASLTDSGECRPGRAPGPARRPRPAGAAGRRLCPYRRRRGRHAGPYPDHALRREP